MFIVEETTKLKYSYMNLYSFSGIENDVDGTECGNEMEVKQHQQLQSVDDSEVCALSGQFQKYI